MSYAEHGPRIFLAGKPGNKTPQIYGDYVLPRKRSEGRLKIYDSCSDVRAWSSNPLENSRYFRELTEHASTPGKIVPFNVVIDNLIGLGSQAQIELAAVKKELRKYKSLVLTPEQERQLAAVDEITVNDHRRAERSRSVGNDRYDLGFDRSPVTPIEWNRHTVSRSSDVINEKEGSAREQSIVSSSSSSEVVAVREIEAQSATATTRQRSDDSHRRDETKQEEETSKNCAIHRKPSPDRDEIDADCTADESRAPAEDSIDERSASDKTNSATTKGTPMPSSSTDEYSENEEPNDRCNETEKGSRRDGSRDLRQSKIVHTEYTSESYETSGSGAESDSETRSSSGSESGSEKEAHKAIIIEKDSEIISLKHDLAVKDAELDELKELNGKLEATIKEKEDYSNRLKGSLIMSQEQLAGMGDRRNYEIEGMRSKLDACKREVNKLRKQLDEQSEVCNEQSQEIKKLHFQLKEAGLLRLERDLLASKLEEMNSLTKEAEKCTEALKVVIRERDELKSQVNEQRCALADQEEEIQLLMEKLKRTSDNYDNRQVKMKKALEQLKEELRGKNSKIFQREKQLSFMERKVGDLTVSLNSMDKFKIAYEDAYNCTGPNQDVCSQAKMGERNIERQDFFKQLEDLKNCVKANKCRSCSQSQQKFSRFDRDPSGKPALHFASVKDLNLKYRDNKDESPVEISATRLTPLEMKKRKCALQEELQELDRSLAGYVELDATMGGEEVPATISRDDIAVTAKQAIDRLNKPFVNMDKWKCEKARMQDTIKIPGIEKATLSKIVGDDNGVESTIVEKFATSLIKMEHLTNELQPYQNERKNMLRQIHNLKDTLRDAEIAAGCQGAIMLKQRLDEIRNEHKKECDEYIREIEGLRKQLDEVESDASCSKVMIHRKKLLELLRNSSYDVKIDRALAIHIRKSIDKINELSIAIDGANDERTTIVKEITKRQLEVCSRDEEIKSLKEQIRVRAMEQRGEGDQVVRENNYTQIELLRKALDEHEQELVSKNGKIQETTERLEACEFKVVGSQKECASLKETVKRLIDEKEKLQMAYEKNANELRMENERIAKDLTANARTRERELEGRIAEMEHALEAVRNENAKLQVENVTARGLLSEKDDKILKLMEENERVVETFTCDVGKYQSEMREKDLKIERLEGEKAEQLKETETRIDNLNDTISVLMTDPEQLDRIQELRKDTSKLDKDKRKLEVELGKYKTELKRHENNNRKLESDLNAVLEEIETWKYKITNLKGETDKFLMGEVSGGERFAVLSNKLYGVITTWKSQLDVSELEKDSFNDQVTQWQAKLAEDVSLIEELRCEVQIQNDRVRSQEEKILLLENANKDLKSELDGCLNELKEFTIRATKWEKENEKENKEKDACEKSPRNCDEFGATGSEMSISNAVEIERKVNCLMNERKHQNIEIERLTCDIEAKNSEIATLRNNIDRLTMERNEILAELKDTINQHNDTLMAVKQKYKRIEELLHEKHNESVKRLEAQYKEMMEGQPFDSETWLRSLSPSEMAELHRRICTMDSCVIAKRVETSKIGESNDQKSQERFDERDESRAKVITCANNAAQREEEALQRVYELELVVERKQKKLRELTKTVAMEQRRNSELQNRLIQNSQSQNKIRNHGKSQSRGRSQNRRSHNSDTSDVERDAFRKHFDLGQDCAENAGDPYRRQKRMQDSELMPNAEPTKDETFDWQRKDFIHQCSIHHKYDNSR